MAHITHTTSTRFIIKVALCAWGIMMMMMCTIMMARHSIPLPAQSASDEEVSKALGTMREYTDDQDQWLMVHVFLASCPCSKRLAHYLLERPTPSGARDKILLVGDDPEWRALANKRGLDVRVVEPEHLESDYHLQAAPLLVILDPLNRVRYMGGYTSRKQGPDVQDLEILHDIRLDMSVEALPLFGCAVSRELRQIIDPTGWF